MSKVKICGLRRPEDISYVNKYLPEYVGFVFAKSKRQVSIKEAAELALKLDKRIKRAGVFVNETIENIVNTVKVCKLYVVQIHGDEDPSYVSDLKKELLKEGFNSTEENKVQIWKGIRVKDETSFEEMEKFEADAYLLDAFIEGSYGGAGKTFDWNLAIKAKAYGNIILAGGLTPDNLIGARNKVNPAVLDVSSGVETEGFKDDEKICRFINMARCY